MKNDNLIKQIEDQMVCSVCGSDDCLCEGNECYDCSGQGYYVDCFDDLCAGSDHCIHGDGDRFCVNCHGSGTVYPRWITWKEYRERQEAKNLAHLQENGA